jgi:hypothetical protein
MTDDVIDAMPGAVHARWSGYVHEVLASSLDIRAIWSIGHGPIEYRGDAQQLRLLAFGSAAVLERLRKCDRLHRADVELLVVVDGDFFASAWGPAVWTGSLARWAWQETAPGEAYYDESRWAQSGGQVVRIRRRALLLWRRADLQAGSAKRGYKV